MICSFCHIGPQDTPRPGLRRCHHHPPYVFSVPLRRTCTRMALFPGTLKLESRNCPEIVPVGVPGLWELVTPDCEIWSRRGIPYCFLILGMRTSGIGSIYWQKTYICFKKQKITKQWTITWTLTRGHCAYEGLTYYLWCNQISYDLQISKNAMSFSMCKELVGIRTPSS
jgi:hypothetical protein